MFFLYFLFSLLELSAKMIWSTYSITINLGDDVLSELQKIEVNIVVDGIVIDDDIIYRYDNVERTSLSTINTGIVKTYKHKIEAYSPKYKIRETVEISIKIIDNIKPEFRYIKEFKIPLNSKMPNLLEDIIVEDNYDSSEHLVVKVDNSRVNLNKTGKYPLVYTVTDRSGNYSIETTYLYVEDYSSPEIKVLKPLKHPVGEIFKWEQYFKITDDDMFVKVVIDSFNINIIGEYPFYLEAIDNSGNKTVIETVIEIIDNIPPSLIITKDRNNIAYGDEEYIKKLRNYIVSVSDNYDTLSIDDVLIETNLNPYELGTYLVIYEVKDSSKLVTRQEIQIKVTDQEKPTINVLDYYILEIYSNKIFIEDLIDVDDNVSKKEDIKIDITGTYNLDKLGEYIITIKATDEAGNINIKKTLITVVDNQPPEIKKINDVIITEFEKPNYNDFYFIFDNYDKTPLLTISDESVNYNKIGKYLITITAEDSEGNKTIIEDFVEVVDIYPPEIVLYQNIIYLNNKNSYFDYKTLIKEVYDNYDVLTKSDVIIVANIDYDKYSEQEIYFYLEDISKNVKEEKLIVFIYEDNDLDIDIRDVVIKQNDDFDLMDGLNIDLSKYEVITYPNRISTSEPGIYYVTYLFINQSGNTIEIDREIVIESNEQKSLLLKFIPMVVLVLIGVFISGFFYYKKRKHIF